MLYKLQHSNIPSTTKPGQGKTQTALQVVVHYGAYHKIRSAANSSSEGTLMREGLQIVANADSIKRLRYE